MYQEKSWRFVLLVLCLSENSLILNLGLGAAWWGVRANSGPEVTMVTQTQPTSQVPVTLRNTVGNLHTYHPHSYPQRGRGQGGGGKSSRLHKPTAKQASSGRQSSNPWILLISPPRTMMEAYHWLATASCLTLSQCLTLKIINNFKNTCASLPEGENFI